MFFRFQSNRWKIVYGLGAIKNVGFEAITIINERENGKFKSLLDFINRIDAKDVTTSVRGFDKSRSI